MQSLTQILFGKSHGAGYLTAVILLVAVMMATIIGAIVFFAFSSGVTLAGTGNQDKFNTTKTTVINYAVTVFALMAIVPLIMVGGLMLRSLGFMAGGGEV
jgi:hypothetical protein